MIDKAIILCAGYGTRLGGLTRSIPKPMLPVKGRPLLEYAIRYLACQNIKRIAINVHFCSEQIIGYFKEGNSFGVSITYFHEQELLGTAGAVKNMSDWISDSNNFCVFYGDLLIDMDLTELFSFHCRKNALATIVLHCRKGSNSIVKMNEESRIVKFIERPLDAHRAEIENPWVNSGVYAFHSDILKFIPAKQTLDFPGDIFGKIIDREQLLGFPLTGYRCAVDSPERYDRAERAVENGEYTFIWEN